MNIKEVVLPTEKERITSFLEQFGLRFESNIDQTVYMEDESGIIATLSASKYILKCLAVKPEYRSENLAVTLVSEMIKRLHSAGIYYFQVFTKPEYREVFLSLGFSPVLETDKVAVMEGGESNINSCIEKMRVQMKYNLGMDSVSGESDIACAVINGDPFTNGHLKLVEYAAARHKYVLVFVVQEDCSYFTFKERFAMAYLALKPISNVLILPSSEYIVSKATFPGYFLKTADETTAEYAKYDALIFDKYFMPGLGIRKRYVGTETSDYMRIYNQTLQDVLKDKLEIVPRFEENGEVISANKVRSLIKEGKTEEALQFIPRNNYSVIQAIILSKHV